MKASEKPTVFHLYQWKTNRPTYLGRIVASMMQFPPVADLVTVGIEVRASDQPRVLRRALQAGGTQ